MKKLLLNALLIITLISAQSRVIAEDIDLFAGNAPAETKIPNVLIILDNTANWSSPFEDEIIALDSVVSNLPPDKFRLGLMMFTETGGGNSGTDGAYVRAAIRDFDTDYKTKFLSLINSLDKTEDRSNSGKIGKAMQEAYLYFAGLAPSAGNNKNKTDFTGNNTGTAASKAIYGLAGNALSTKAGNVYNNSFVTDGCANNYVIYISNGAAQDSNADTTQAAAALTALGGSTATIPISPSGSQSNVADEWSRFMKQSQYGITSYTIDINKVTTGQGPGWTALLKSVANQSTGKYFDVSSANAGSEIIAALNSIFTEIQSVNSVFASVSLPVSVNTQGTFLNQVYIGMFRPDQNSLPRWDGNLKQYKLAILNGQLRLVDADNASAINSSTGFITGCARSFWTPATIDSYWSFRPTNNCLTPNTNISNSPDGNIVEKGAQAQQLRSSTTRNVKTCNVGSCTSLTDFTTANTAITDTQLGAANATERARIINWQRGLDTEDENTNGVTTAEMRPSTHGDVVHSRPVAINYGTDATPQVVVFYGGNDGILRAVNGNRSTNLGTAAPGQEIWSFVAPEFYGKIKRIYENEVSINFPGNTASIPAPAAKDYGVDGPVTAYRNGSTAWLYATMRRGGRTIYAFDVSSVANPTLKWRLGCPNASNDTGCSTGFSGIGQTWTTPKIINAAGYGAGLSPLLVMGGGYDTCHDADPNTGCSSASKGRRIYVIDANTGVLQTTFETDGSVIGEITVLTDSDDKIKYAYAADLNGNLYRISGSNANTPIGSTAPSGWTMTKVAALGGSGSENRKFMFGPDAIEEDNGNITLLLGSGDREKPLNVYTASNSVSNYFFKIDDRPTDAAWLTSENTNCGANVICLNSLLPILSNATPTSAQLTGKKGWYLGLQPTEGTVTSAITVFGTVTFSTFKPTAPEIGSCSVDLGTATVYNINYKNAESANGSLVRGETIVGGGLPPSPVAGMVTLDDGTTVPFIIGASPNSPIEGSDPPMPPTRSRPKSRVYWNIVK